MEAATPPQQAAFNVLLSFQGKAVTLEGITTQTTANDLHDRILAALQLSNETAVKLLYKGKQIGGGSGAATTTSTAPVFSSIPKKTPKIIVMATSKIVLRQEATKRSDPTIRGFDQERPPPNAMKDRTTQHWGEEMSQQDANYKFCRFQSCSWQSFGHRPSDSTPHDFVATQLLEKLATDPGVVAVMKERELVVGTLGEMDPIDDRLMKKKQQEQHGACLLGYNTNGGQRIDIKLRTDDLSGFRPYPELVATLLHELSHNWVGEHNLLFWTNYAQMRAEYLYRHKALQSTLIGGQTTAELAGLVSSLDNIPGLILNELVREMSQHGLHPRAIEAPIRQRCRELEEQLLRGVTLGMSEGAVNKTSGSARERALAAAEQRLAAQKQQQQDEGQEKKRKDPPPNRP